MNPKIIEGVGKVAEVFPKMYEDLLQPSVQETGKIIATLPKAINAAFLPLNKWILNREYNFEETKKLLAQKLENVDINKIVTPEAYVAVPAVQAISYSMNSEELRNLYANLLASSMNMDTKQMVHPSFVEIIKQITPDEAKLLKYLSQNGDAYPLIDVQLFSNHKDSYMTVLHNFTDIANGICENPDQITAYLDNLIRLNIIGIPFGVKFASDEIYKSLEENEQIKELMNSPAPENHKWKIERSKFELTQYGKFFINICVKDVEESNY